VVKKKARPKPKARVERVVGWSDSELAYPYHQYLVPAFLEELESCLGSGSKRVIDLGSGNGYVTDQIARRGHEVIGVESSSDGLAVARRNFPTLRFMDASLYDPGLKARLGARADCVVALEVVEHLFSPRELFRTARKLLRPGGWLILSTPYHGYLKNLAIAMTDGWDKHLEAHSDGGHVKFFSKRTLGVMMAEEGFTPRRFRGCGRLPFLWKAMIVCAQVTDETPAAGR
jgi:2-polyprenyl-3-methyl-5-hydroxy-6-metoxy-1,4-benzoquinol methylase